MIITRFKWDGEIEYETEPEEGEVKCEACGEVISEDDAEHEEGFGWVCNRTCRG